MIAEDEKLELIQSKLIPFLLERFHAAHIAGQSQTSQIPQVCAALASTKDSAGDIATQLVAGIAPQAACPNNPDREDAVQILHKALGSVPFLSADFKVVSIAITTTIDAAGKPQGIDVGLFEQSLSELPLTATEFVVVDPFTQHISTSMPFSDYRILS